MRVTAYFGVFFADAFDADALGFSEQGFAALFEHLQFGLDGFGSGYDFRGRSSFSHSMSCLS